jgi:hypothetical protein
MTEQTVTRFVIKRGLDDYLINAEGEWGNLWDARLFETMPFWIHTEGTRIVMVSVTLKELPYEVSQNNS